MLLFAEHFDGYTDTTGYRNALNPFTGGSIYQAAGGRFGGGCVENGALNIGDHVALKAAPGSNMIRLAFHIKCGRIVSTSNNRDIIQLTNAAATRYWRIIGNGNASAANLIASKFDDAYPPAQLAASTKKCWNDGAWHHFEIALSVSTTVGSFKLKMDGIVIDEFTVTLGDTSDAVSLDATAIDRMWFCGANSNTGGMNGLYIDDLIVWDDTGTGFTGELAAEHRLRKVDPTANGAGGQQWTPLAGFNYANVDEPNYNSDTDYVSETVAGEIDYYAISSLGWTPVNIESVIVESIGRSDTGTHIWRNKLLSSAAVGNGANITATTTYRKTYDSFEVDPNTSAAWTAANVEAAQFGVEFVS